MTFALHHPALPAGTRIVFEAANDFHAEQIAHDLLGRRPGLGELVEYTGAGMFDITIEEAREALKA